MTKMQPYFLEHASLTTADKLELPGLWYTPRDTRRDTQHTQTKTAVIFLHGCGSSSVFYKQQKMSIFADALTQKNIAFLAFNNRGAHYIKRFSKPLADGETEKILLGTGYEKIEDCIFDIDAAINFVQQQGITNIILLGESTGANKIVVYNSLKKSNPVRAYALIGAGDDQGLWANTFGLESWQQVLAECKSNIETGREEYLYSTDPKLGFLSYRSLYDVLNPDGLYNCFPFYEHFSKQKWSQNELFGDWKKINKPTLVLYGSEDKFCSVPAEKAAEHLFKIHPQPDFISIRVEENADHSFSEHVHEEINAVLEWLSSIMTSF